MGKIGNIIFKIREESGISQKQLCTDLCSPATLSRLERGEGVNSMLLLDMLLQRMGKSPDNFWSIVHINDYKIIEARRSIWNNLLCGEYKKAEQEIDQYEQSVEGMETIHNHFTLTCRGYLKGKAENAWEEAKDYLWQAVKTTQPDFLIENSEDILLGRKEIMTVLLLAEAYDKTGGMETAECIVEKVLQNIEKKKWEEEELVKIYPKAVRYYIEFLKKEDKYQEVITLSRKAFRMLADNGVIFLLAEMLDCTIWGIEKKKSVNGGELPESEQLEYEEIKEQRDVLQEIWKEYGVFPAENMIYATNIQRDVSISNEIISRCRKLCGLSQEKLSEEICSVENLSRIETGRSSPQEKNYRALMEKMQQAQERNRYMISTQEYEIYEKLRQIEKNIAAIEYGKVAELWKEVRESIPKDSLKNQQYIMRYDTLVKYRHNEISSKQAFQGYQSALALTIVEAEEADIENWPLSRNEIFLLNMIIQYYVEMNNLKKAEEILEAIRKNIENSQAGKLYRSAEHRLNLYNLAILKIYMKKYTESLNIVEELLSFNMEIGRVELTVQTLYVKGCILNEQDSQKNKQKAQNLIKNAYKIGDILKAEKIKEKLEEYYMESWNESINSRISYKMEKIVKPW